MQSKLREKITQEFLNCLKEDKLPWHAMWNTMRPQNAISGKNYRGVNSFWLSFISDEKGYGDHRWCTYKQAQDNGWQVKKDEKSTHIEYWRLYDKLQKRYVEQDEARQIIAADPDREKDIILSCRTYCVFNAAQIEGIPALERPSSVDIADVRAKRDVLMKNMGLQFREGGSEAYYDPRRDRITMPVESSFVDTYGYMSTLLHESSHATGHKSRLDRDLSGTFGSESYAKEELRAEIASAFTSQALGFGRQEGDLSSGMDNHKAYIQSWIEAIQNKPNELFAAIKDAESISDYLLDKGEFLKAFDHQQGREEEKQSKSPLSERIQGATLKVSNQARKNTPEPALSR